jgi:hypothetical protein
MRLLLGISAFVFLLSCNQSKTEDSEKKPDLIAGKNPSIDSVIDSINNFKALPLTIKDEHSDVDELIPVGYNDQGSLAYFINENTGASNSVRFDIVSPYDDFTSRSIFSRDEGIDSTLLKNKRLFYELLVTGGIKLHNNIQKLSIDSLKRIYGIIFDTRKTFGGPVPDYTSVKTLATVSIKYHQDDHPEMSVINKKYSPSDGIYDQYVSDILVVPSGKERYGFMVIVLESLGFEGYTRKTIEVSPMGALENKE